MESRMQDIKSSLTSTSIGRDLLLPDDVWGEVFSFFCDDHSIANMLLLSKQMRRIIHNYTKISVHICRYKVDDWSSVYSWLKKFKRLSCVDIASSNCKSIAISTIVQNLNLMQMTTKTPPAISITKCFSLGDDFVPQLVNFHQVALCDMELKHPIPTLFFAQLRALVFSNSVFRIGSLQLLFENIPSTLTFIAFGGCRNIELSFDPTSLLVESDGAIAGCGRSDLCIEVTFIEEKSDQFKCLRAHFPRAVWMNLEKESVETLGAKYAQFDMKERRLSRAMTSCNNNRTNMTPLHIACWDGDVERCHWLLAVNARHDLKDYKGCTPLHRALESIALANLEKVHNSRVKMTSTGEIEADIKQLLPSVTSPFIHLNHLYETFRDESLPQAVWPRPGTTAHNGWLCSVLCLEAGASCFIRNQNYETPLYVAALRGNDCVLHSMIAHLRRLEPEGGGGGSNVHLRIDERGSDLREFSPLQAAILARSLSSVAILLAAGCSPNKQNKFGATALHLVYRSGMPELIALIREAGGREDIKDNSGDLPADYSSETRQAKKKKSRTSGRKKTRAPASGNK